MALESILEDLNGALFRALSGPKALRLIIKHDFAFALIDAQMPDVNGFELPELIRGRRETEHLPIIFVTAILCVLLRSLGKKYWGMRWFYKSYRAVRYARIVPTNTGSHCDSVIATPVIMALANAGIESSNPEFEKYARAFPRIEPSQ